MNMTLPTDSAERKTVPLYSGCLAYFPAALAGVAAHSHKGNEKHSPGQPLHHARGKSGDHEDCIIRHLTDLADMLARVGRTDDYEVPAVYGAILEEVNALAWRALALSQELHEKYGGAPLAPAARLPSEEQVQASDDSFPWIETFEDLAPQDSWIAHDPEVDGKRPVSLDSDVMIEALLRNGLVRVGRAGGFRWDSHQKVYYYDYDIVGYRVLSE